MKTLSLKTYQQLKNHFNHQNIKVRLLTTKINHKILILNQVCKNSILMN